MRLPIGASPLADLASFGAGYKVYDTSAVIYHTVLYSDDKV